MKKKNAVYFSKTCVTAAIGFTLVMLLVYIAQVQIVEKKQKSNMDIDLNMATYRLLQNVEDTQIDWGIYDDFVESKVATVAWLLDRMPELEDNLSEVASRCGLQKILLTDREGNIRASCGIVGETLEEVGLSRLLDHLEQRTEKEYVTLGDQEKTCYYLTLRQDGSCVVGGRNSTETVRNQDERVEVGYSLKNIRVGRKGDFIAVNLDEDSVEYSVNEDWIGLSSSEIGIPQGMEEGKMEWIQCSDGNFYAESVWLVS